MEIRHSGEDRQALTGEFQGSQDEESNDGVGEVNAKCVAPYINKGRPGRTGNFEEQEGDRKGEELVTGAQGIEGVGVVQGPEQSGLAVGQRCGGKRQNDKDGHGEPRESPVEAVEVVGNIAAEPEVEDESEYGLGMEGWEPKTIDVDNVDEIYGEEEDAELQGIEEATKGQNRRQAYEEVGNEPVSGVEETVGKSPVDGLERVRAPKIVCSDEKGEVQDGVDAEPGEPGEEDALGALGEVLEGIAAVDPLAHEKTGDKKEADSSKLEGGGQGEGETTMSQNRR